MRLMSFKIDGRASFGLAAGDGVIDAGKRLDGEFRGLRDALLAARYRRSAVSSRRSPTYALTDVEFLPVIPMRAQAALHRDQLCAAHEGNGSRAARVSGRVRALPGQHRRPRRSR